MLPLYIRPCFSFRCGTLPPVRPCLPLRETLPSVKPCCTQTSARCFFRPEIAMTPCLLWYPAFCPVYDIYFNLLAQWVRPCLPVMRDPVRSMRPCDLLCARPLLLSCVTPCLLSYARPSFAICETLPFVTCPTLLSLTCEVLPSVLCATLPSMRPSLLSHVGPCLQWGPAVCESLRFCEAFPPVPSVRPCLCS